MFKTIKNAINNTIDATIINAFTIISRYFVTLDPVLNSYYELAAPITFAGDFEVEVDAYESIANYGGVISGSNFEFLTREDSNLEKMSVLVNGVPLNLESAFSRTVFNNLKITRTDSTTTIVTNLGTFDASAVFGSATINIDAIGKNTSGIGGPDYFDGIIANAKFTDKSGASDVVTTFKLDNSPAAANYTYSTELLDNNTFPDNANARQYLVATKGWIITDGGAA